MGLNELETVWKQAAMIKLMYLPGGAEDNHEYPCQDSQSSGPNLNPGYHECEVGMPASRQRQRNPLIGYACIELLNVCNPG
jgi:hypothetical protein